VVESDGLCPNERDEMSELREQCTVLANSLEPFIVVNYDKSGSGYAKQIEALEAFAREQRIKGMEAVRSELSRRIHVLDGRLEGCDGDDWIELNATISTNCEAMAWIDAEIKTLKEGE